MTSYECDRCDAIFNQEALNLDGHGERCPACGSPIFSLAGIIQFFEIPMPVSANRMWRTSRGHHHLAPDYVAFIDALGWYCKIQRIKPQPTPCRFTLLVRGGKGWRISNDLDNRLKPTLDALVHNDILTNDSVIHVPQQELIYIERPSRAADVRCFVRLGDLDPTWSGFVPPPSGDLDAMLRLGHQQEEQQHERQDNPPTDHPRGARRRLRLAV